MAFFNIDRRFGLHTIHKCASSAIQNALPKSGLWFSQVTINDYLRLNHRVVFIRDPYKRCASAYRMYKALAEKPHWKQHDITSFDAWVHSLCREGAAPDPHTRPQFWHVTKQGFTPTEIIRWDFDRLAKLLGIEKIEPYNVTFKQDKPTEWNDEITALFDKWYAADLALWRGQIDCTSSGQPVDKLGWLDRKDLHGEKKETE